MFIKYYKIKKRWSNNKGTGVGLEPKGLLIAKKTPIAKFKKPQVKIEEEVRIGYSLCCRKDTFVKKKAREIAEARLSKANYTANLHNHVELNQLADKIPQSLQQIFWQAVNFLQTRTH